MRQPIDRVSHVVYCLRPEHLEAAAELLAEVLGATFENADRPEFGLRIRISLANGLELIAPDPAIGPVADRFARFLEERGEGVYNIVYGLAELDGAAARAERAGVRVTHRGSFAHLEPWAGRFEVLDEVHLEPFHGIQVTLGRIEPKDG